jgi:glutamyl-tRNA synthetase
MSDNTEKKPVITRFAPSPTGFMHIGGVRTALYAWLWARKNKGTFILRIEDTDKEREVAGSIEHIQKSLTWLGIDWDFGPDKPGPFGSCIQSLRLDTYREYAQKLIDKGLAYPDPYTQEQIDAFRKQAEANKQAFLFRNYRPKEVDQPGYKAVWDGKKPLRLKVPEIKRYKWHDIVRGDLEAGEEALDDFILIKADGYPTYNFAHIIDDLNMGVTHIIRGDEFISSTPRFLSLYDALGITPPQFVSLPPILRDDRTKKLGKRDGAKDILEYKTEGYLPEAMMNFLALIGWNPGGSEEIMDSRELMAQFSLEKIQKAGGAFNEEKLLWMNKMYMAKLSDKEFLKLAKNFLPENLRGENEKNSSENNLQKVMKLLPLIREKIQVFSEIPELFGPAGELSFLNSPSQYPKTALMWKKEKDISNVATHINAVIKALEPLADTDADFTADKIKAAIWPYAESVPAEAGGRGSVLWPMRYALSGKEKSPDPFIMAGVLGKKETLIRLNKALELIKTT